MWSRREKLRAVVGVMSKEEHGLNGAVLQLKMERLRLKVNVRTEVKAELRVRSLKEAAESSSYRPQQSPTSLHNIIAYIIR